MVLNVNAANFVNTLTAGFTRQQYIDFIKERYSACGFPTPTEKVDATLHILAYSLNLAPSATYGEVVFVIEIGTLAANLTVTEKLFAKQNYNLTTFTGTTNTGATAQTVTLVVAKSYTFYAIPLSANVDFAGLAVIEDGVTAKYFMGINRPTTMESWYNENNWVFTGLVTAGTPNSATLPFPNPLAASSATAVTRRSQLATFATRNPVNNKIQLLLAPFYTLQTWGIDSQGKSDVAICNSSGYYIGDILVKEAGVEEYWLLWPGDSGVAVRSV